MINSPLRQSYQRLIILGLITLNLKVFAQDQGDDPMEFPFIVGTMDKIIPAEKLEERSKKIIKKFKYNEKENIEIKDRDAIFNVSLGQYGLLTCHDETKLLNTVGLGPCIGIIISDPEKGITVLGHKTSLNPSETVVKTLVSEIRNAGGEPKSIKLFWSKRGNLRNLIPLLEEFKKLDLTPNYMTNWRNVSTDCKGKVYSEIIDNDPLFLFEKERRSVTEEKLKKENGMYQRYPMQKVYSSINLGKRSNRCIEENNKDTRLDQLEIDTNNIIQEYGL